jgi:anti-sigma B factor antagonist
MDLSFRIDGGAVDADTQVVEAHGELDVATAPELEVALDAAIETGKRFVVVDLCEVRLVDATTLGVMLRAQRRLEANGGRLVTICSDRRLARVFEITGLVDALGVTSSRREALSRAQHFARAV